MNELPARINAMKVVSYDVEEIVGYISDFREKPVEEITLDNVLEWIEDDVEQDISNGDVIYHDENGSEL